MRAGLVLVLVACSGGVHEIPIDPVPSRMTQAQLAGPLCSGQQCKCRDATTSGPGGAGTPEAGKKRFEIRLQSAQELWAKVGGSLLYKSPEQAEQCFYVDLAPGQTPVMLRASDKNGVSAGMTIKELGSKTQSWYDTVTFNCGAPGVCSLDNLDQFKQQVAAAPHHVMDLCGSVKLKSVDWATQRGPDELHPGELQLQLVLDVYKRVPTQPHGDPSCGKGPPPAE